MQNNQTVPLKSKKNNMPNSNCCSDTQSMNHQPLYQLDYLKYLTSNGGPEPEDYDELTACFQSIGDHVKQGRLSYEEDLSAWWKNLGEAFSSLFTMQGFAVMKPHGYAGDFEIIDRIYQCWMSPHAHLTKWDRYFHEQAAPKAVRNRKAYFCNLVADSLRTRPPGKMDILNVGCGSARDVLECLHLQRNTGHISIDCLDQDPKAIAYAENVTKDYASQVRFILCNAFKYRPEKDYDLAWSAGLFDYLDDKAFCFLLRRLYGSVKSGGGVAIGNFSENNSSRDYMEFGGWLLRHRSEDQLVELARSCGLPANNIAVEKEPEGVNLFLRIRKD
jgi:SAM-dependent methyltransferase